MLRDLKNFFGFGAAGVGASGFGSMSVSKEKGSAGGLLVRGT